LSNYSFFDSIRYCCWFHSALNFQFPVEPATFFYPALLTPFFFIATSIVNNSNVLVINCTIVLTRLDDENSFSCGKIQGQNSRWATLFLWQRKLVWQFTCFVVWSIFVSRQNPSTYFTSFPDPSRTPAEFHSLHLKPTKRFRNNAWEESFWIEANRNQPKTNKMWKVDIPIDTKEAVAIARRKTAEDARMKRIFNPKQRMIGVSIEKMVHMMPY